jgi:hypothetical protein
MNPIVPTRAEIFRLLEENDLDTLIPILKYKAIEEKNFDLEQQIILLSSRYNQYVQQHQLELAEEKELRVELNKIKMGLLNLVNQLNLDPGKPQLSSQKIQKARLNKITIIQLMVVFIALSFLSVLFYLAQVRLTNPQFTLKAKVSQLGLRTTQSWIPGNGVDLWLRRFEAYHLANFSSFSTSLYSNVDRPLSLFFSKGRIRIDSISFLPKHEIILLMDGDELQLKLNNGAIKGGLFLKNSQLSSPDLGIEQKLGVNPLGDFFMFDSEENPEFSLMPARKGGLELPPMEVDSVFLFRLENNINVSTIQEGALQIGGARPITLTSGAPILLSNLRQGKIHFNQLDQYLEIELTGQVGKIAHIQNGDVKSMMPTLLEHLRINTMLYYAIITGLALMGIFYAFKKMLLTQKRRLL